TTWPRDWSSDVCSSDLGVAANANIQFIEFTQHGLPAPMFYPTFPSDLVFFLLGAPVLLPIGLWLSSAGLGLWLQRREPWLWATKIGRASCRERVGGSEH